MVLAAAVFIQMRTEIRCRMQKSEAVRNRLSLVNTRKVFDIWIRKVWIFPWWRKKSFSGKILWLPLKKERRLGKAVYRLNGEVLGEVPIVAGETLKKAEFLDYLKKLWERYQSI